MNKPKQGPPPDPEPENHPDVVDFDPNWRNRPAKVTVSVCPCCKQDVPASSRLRTQLTPMTHAHLCELCHDAVAGLEPVPGDPVVGRQDIVYEYIAETRNRDEKIKLMMGQLTAREYWLDDDPGSPQSMECEVEAFEDDAGLDIDRFVELRSKTEDGKPLTEVELYAVLVANAAIVELSKRVVQLSNDMTTRARRLMEDDGTRFGQFVQKIGPASPGNGNKDGGVDD